VGKAKNLRRRLASYFQRRLKYRRIRRLVEQIRNIEVILVNNETESLVLENNLIKRHRPRYNRALMRAGSGYPYIVLTGEPFPRLLPYHKDRYNPELIQLETLAVERRFGPYLNRRIRDAILEYAIENFGLRTCQPMPKRLCLLYHLGRCCGPCEGRVTDVGYHRAVERAAAFLSTSQHTDLVREMKARMWACAEKLEFERARRIRDQVEALESLLDRQVVERDLDHDQHVIYFGETHALRMEINRGALHGLALVELAQATADGHGFLIEYYSRNSPPELIINQLARPTEIEAHLTAANGYPVRITLPADGITAALVELGRRNYHYRLTGLIDATGRS
jgi:excinuclease ABC subunit C